MKELWNKRYNQSGKIILPCKGESSNAVYTSTKGINLVAINFYNKINRK